MSAEENKAIQRRYMEEVWNKGNPDAVDEFVARNFVLPGAPPGVAPGFEGVKQAVTIHRTGFPDLRWTMEDQLAEGDKVASRSTVRGTHKGEWAGIPPTGKQVEFTMLSIARFAGGKLVEEWIESDMLGVMQQLGVVPPPGQAGG